MSDLLQTACLLAALLREDPTDEGNALMLVAHVRDNAGAFAKVFGIDAEELRAFVTTGPAVLPGESAAQVVVADLLRRLSRLVQTNK